MKMKNVIKIALLSTVAMVGAAQAGIDVSVKEGIEAKLKAVYDVFDVGSTNVEPNQIVTDQLDAIFVKVDDFYSADSVVTTNIKTFDWGIGTSGFGETATTHTTAINDEFESGISFSDHLGDTVQVLKDAVVTDVWGNKDGKSYYQTQAANGSNSIELFSTIHGSNALLGATAIAVHSKYNEVIIEADKVARGTSTAEGTTLLDDLVGQFSSNVTSFVDQANAVDVKISDYATEDFTTVGYSTQDSLPGQTQP